MFSRVRRLALVIVPLATYAVVGLATVAEAATVTKLSPVFGPVGRHVDIYGSGLTGAKDVKFHGVDAGKPTFIDDGHLRTTVPAGATTGAVVVTALDGSKVSGGTFWVQQPTSATIVRSTRVVQYPSRVTIRSVLRSDGDPVAGQTARLQRALPGTKDWHRTGLIKSTSSTGVVSWSFSPYRLFVYRAVFAATRTHLGTRSPWTWVYVRPKVTISAPGVAPLSTRFRITARVRPGADGAVYLQRYRDGGWHRVARAQKSSRGHYFAPVSLSAATTYVYRFRRPHDGAHTTAVSHSVRILGVTRTLSSGMSGADVTALQRELHKLHYDVGRVTGSFGFDTQHAVVAFEKVQGITRDGVVGKAVWTRLTAPRRPHLLHPFAKAAGVEVDLTHQVLLYGVAGHVRRIFDTSTGGGYTYTGSDGQLHKAITPTGHFHIVYKRDGWVTSDLGKLYRPAYFNYDGYAIHGEGEVPSYPASHGCVRITVPAMDRFNSKLPVGLSVWIYRL